MKNNRFMNVLLKAKEENIAVGAVNIFNYLTAEAAVKAAEEIGVNLIIQTSAGTVEHFGAQKLYDIVDAARKGAELNDVEKKNLNKLHYILITAVIKNLESFAQILDGTAL